MSNFLCLWIPQFPAWALAQSEFTLTPSVTAPSVTKQLDVEELETTPQPFAVCERGVVIAASSQALEAGVQVGITSNRAQSLCPHLLIVPRDKAREALAWAEVQRAMYGLTPYIESIEPGLLFAGVEAKQALPLIAKWNAQAGQAQDRATAHLVAVTASAGEVRCLRPGREASFADRVALETLCAAGLSTRLLERLDKSGWKSVGALRVLSQRELEEVVGSQSELLYRLAKGGLCAANVRPLSAWTPPKELTAKITFEWPARESCDWEPILDELLQRVWQELDADNAQSLEVIAQTPLAPVAVRRLLKKPTSELSRLECCARAALQQALQTLAPLPPVLLGLEVRLGHLVAPAEHPTRTNRLKAALERVETRLWGKTERVLELIPESRVSEESADCVATPEDTMPSRKQKLA